MVDGLMNLIPSARVGHVGLYRDPETLQPHEYFVKIPSNPEERHFIVVDPMLATGGSAIAAIDSLKQRGVTDINLCCLNSSSRRCKSITRCSPRCRYFYRWL